MRSGLLWIITAFALLFPAVAGAAPFTSITELNEPAPCTPRIAADTDGDTVIIRGCNGNQSSVVVRRGTGSHATTTPPYTANATTLPFLVAFAPTGVAHLIACEFGAGKAKLVEFTLGANATTWSGPTTLVAEATDIGCQYDGRLEFDGATRVLGIRYAANTPSGTSFAYRVYEGSGSTLTATFDAVGQGDMDVAPDGSALAAVGYQGAIKYATRPAGGAFGSPVAFEPAAPSQSAVSSVVAGNGGRALLMAGGQSLTAYLKPGAGQPFGASREFDTFQTAGAASPDGTLQLAFSHNYDRDWTVETVTVAPGATAIPAAVQIARSNGQPVPIAMLPSGASGAVVVFRDAGTFDGTKPPRLRVVHRPSGTPAYTAPVDETDAVLNSTTGLAVASAPGTTLLRVAAQRFVNQTPKLVTADLDLSSVPTTAAPAEETTPPGDATGPSIGTPEVPEGSPPAEAGVPATFVTDLYDFSGIGAIGVKVDGVDVAFTRTDLGSDTARISFSTTFATPGVHTISITATDKASTPNTRTQDFSITVGGVAAPTAPPVPPLPPKDLTAPLISLMKATKSAVTFTSSEAGAAKVTIAYTLKGRRKGSKCITGAKAPKRGQACSSKKKKTLSAVVPAAGPMRVRLPRLLPGKYKITVVVTDAAGNASLPAAKTLTIKKRKTSR